MALNKYCSVCELINNKLLNKPYIFSFPEPLILIDYISVYLDMKALLTFSFLFLIAGCASPQSKYNLDMELLADSKNKAVGWATSFEPAQLKAYPVKVDSLIKQEGRYSMSIEKASNEAKYGVTDYRINKSFNGAAIQLRGYLKTENVDGFAGLWMRIDGLDGQIAFDNMQNRPVKGTNDWKEYVIDLNYDAQKAATIHVGALLLGGGKIWFDNFKIFIDGKPIDQLTPRHTEFESGSKVDSITMTPQRIENLTALGEVWGFLKYHHPSIAQGKYNWDFELFRIMPSVIKANNNLELSRVLEKWVDSLGKPPLCKDCGIHPVGVVQSKPDYGLLFKNSTLSASLTKKLSFILENRNGTKGYYIDTAINGNPTFLNEAAYTLFQYPDAGYRLLCLYRYWNMIQYFYPYKYLIGEDWNKVLAEFVPKFASSANATEYSLNTLALIAKIHDTHASIWKRNEALVSYQGKFGTPFRAEFIENQLVISGYYNDTLNVKQIVKVGDVIQKINGTPIKDLKKQFIPITPASNYVTQLREMPAMFLLRSNNPEFAIDILRKGRLLKVFVRGMDFYKIHYNLTNNRDPKAPAFYLINHKIGYLYAGQYKNHDLHAIEKLFENTKGIIIDMRCYPSDFMPFTIVPYVKNNDAAFGKFTAGNLGEPGLFTFKSSLNTPALKKYKGMVIILVDEHTQSQAEYTTMAFQSSSNVTVIGSQTAGADGDVSEIILPGGISTLISGLGIYYPDGTVAQRAGIKINFVIKPTIKGIEAGRDELLDKAKQIIIAK